jgi:type IV fimbrial biogenesis protein FimT
MKQRYDSGFTLYELLVTVFVIGILLGFGVPNFLQFQRNNAITAAVNDAVSGLYLARTEAVKRQVPTTLCGSPAPLDPAPACGAGGNGGFIVFVDENGNNVLTDATDGNGTLDAGETVLLQRAAPGGTINVSGNGGQYVAYLPSGFAVSPAPGNAQVATNRLLYCDERGNQDLGDGRSTARVVEIAPTGRPQSLQLLAQVANAAAALGADCP